MRSFRGLGQGLGQNCILAVSGEDTALLAMIQCRDSSSADLEGQEGSIHIYDNCAIVFKASRIGLNPEKSTLS